MQHARRLCVIDGSVGKGRLQSTHPGRSHGDQLGQGVLAGGLIPGIQEQLEKVGDLRVREVRARLTDTAKQQAHEP